MLDANSASVVQATGNIVINSLADDVADDGKCTLREAIIAANTDTASGSMPNECVTGDSDDTIDLTGVNGVITLTSTLPDVTTNIIFNGPGTDNLTIDQGFLIKNRRTTTDRFEHAHKSGQ